MGFPFLLLSPRNHPSPLRLFPALKILTLTYPKSFLIDFFAVCLYVIGILLRIAFRIVSFMCFVKPAHTVSLLLSRFIRPSQSTSSSDLFFLFLFDSGLLGYFSFPISLSWESTPSLPESEVPSLLAFHSAIPFSYMARCCSGV